VLTLLINTSKKQNVKAFPSGKNFPEALPIEGEMPKGRGGLLYETEIQYNTVNLYSHSD
jgi:hypothetical protein